jgi:site-specific recombinase XerC
MFTRDALDHWLMALETEGRRPATLSTYRWHWTPFLRFLEEQNLPELDALTPFIIRRWLAEYQKGHSPASLKSTYNSIQAFVRWASREGLLRTDPLKNVRPPRMTRPPRRLSTGGSCAPFLPRYNGTHPPPACAIWP